MAKVVELEHLARVYVALDEQARHARHEMLAVINREVLALCEGDPKEWGALDRVVSLPVEVYSHVWRALGGTEGASPAGKYIITHGDKFGARLAAKGSVGG